MVAVSFISSSRLVFVYHCKIGYILHAHNSISNSLPPRPANSYRVTPRMLPTNANVSTQVETLLERLRKEPVGSEGSTDQIMKVVFDYLINVPEDPLGGTYHWFCQRADNVTQEAAAFLIRLFAYDSQRVDKWKACMKKIIFSCCDCVRALQEVKRTSQQTCVYHCCLMNHHV
jgi:hypothetical protein